MSDKVAVVTGANKGIGYGIVKELCKRGVGVVYLTARDETRGKEAVEALKKEGLNPIFHQLDVSDRESVEAFATHLKEKHGGLDILINNAGVMSADENEIDFKDAKRVINVNYRSILIMQEHLFPLLNENARVINISSDSGHISNVKSSYLIDLLTKKNIKFDDIDGFIDWFLDSVKYGTLNKADFKDSKMLPYKVSKIAVCALTRVQQKEVGRGISVNSIHPGLVKTDMTKNRGYLDVEESGKAPVYLALDVDQSVKGKFFWFDKTERDWADPTLELYTPEELEDIEKIF